MQMGRWVAATWPWARVEEQLIGDSWAVRNRAAKNRRASTNWIAVEPKPAIWPYTLGKRQFFQSKKQGPSDWLHKYTELEFFLGQSVVDLIAQELREVLAMSVVRRAIEVVGCRQDTLPSSLHVDLQFEASSHNWGKQLAS